MTDATVIIAAWNAAETIGRSVDSALAQHSVSIQVVVVDDASDDHIAEAIPERDDVTFLRLARNGGPAQARNAALEIATGAWVCVLDADDTMLPNRLVEMIAEAERYDADIVLGNFARVDSEGRSIDRTPFLSGDEIKPSQLMTLKEYVGRNQVSRHSKSIGYLKPIIRRSFLEHTGVAYKPALRNGEDCHLIFNALASGAKVLIWPKPDYLYTVRDGSISYRANPDHIDALIGADREFLEKNSEIIDVQSVRLFQTRETALRKMMVSERILQALKSVRLGDAIRLASRHPSALPRVGRQLAESVGKKLGLVPKS